MKKKREYQIDWFNLFWGIFLIAVAFIYLALFHDQIETWKQIAISIPADAIGNAAIDKARNGLSYMLATILFPIMILTALFPVTHSIKTKSKGISEEVVNEPDRINKKPADKEVFQIILGFAVIIADLYLLLMASVGSYLAGQTLVNASYSQTNADWISSVSLNSSNVMGIIIAIAGIFLILNGAWPSLIEIKNTILEWLRKKLTENEGDEQK